MNTNLKEEISLLQLYFLIILFQIGSAAVVGVAMEAKQDAWLAILIGTAIGLLITYMYLFILSIEQGKNLFEIMEISFGRYVAIVLTFAYIVYFFYIAARVLRDFTELLSTNIYPNTPIEFLSICLMIVIIYVVYLGLEVLARASETFMPYIGLFLLALAFFLFAGGNVNFSNLQPFLAEGFGPIFKAVFPSLITFPFGEAIALTVVMALTKKKKQMPKVTLLAVLSSGITLTLFKIMKVSVLGISIIGRLSFPLLSAAREISFANFIERIDAIVIFVMMLGVFVKVALFLFAGLKGLEYIFKIPYRYFTIPMGLLIANTSIFISTNYAEHLEEGLEFVPMYLHLPFQIWLPLLIAIIIFFKKKKKKRGENEHVKKMA